MHGLLDTRQMLLLVLELEQRYKAMAKKVSWSIVAPMWRAFMDK